MNERVIHFAALQHCRIGAAATSPLAAIPLQPYP
jgi:hypothetical protein